MEPDLCAKFQIYTIYGFEIQGCKLNNNNNYNNHKKKQNWENQLFVISLLLVMQFLPHFRCTCMLPIVTILWQQN